MGLFYSHFFQVRQIGEDVHIDCRQLVVAQISERTQRGRGRTERNLLKHFLVKHSQQLTISNPSVKSGNVKTIAFLS